jgi:serine/threonine-protein kinase
VGSGSPAATSPSGPTLFVGQVIADSYRIVRRVGTGGMGEIYEAEHLRLAGRYAIKLLRPEIAGNPDALARFEREARVTSALRHPNIVQVVDFSALANGAPFMVMEFLDGLELAQIIKRTGPLPVARVVGLVRQIAAGLTAAHDSGVIHRDLKPQNIFVLDVAGHEQELVKIVDFGISKVKDVTSTITGSSMLMGTIQYMSPEQARGRVDEIDARTDQFALAAIVYEMLVGVDAFTGSDVSSVLYQIVHEQPSGLVGRHDSIPLAIATVLRRALSKDKGNRYPSILAFSAALEGAASEGAAASATTLAEKRSSLDTTAGRPPSRRRATWIAAAAAVLACAWVLIRTPRPPIATPPRSSESTPERKAAPPPPVVPPSRAVEALPPDEPSSRVTAAQAPRGGADESQPAKRPRSIRRSVSVALKPAPAEPASPKINCDPNFFFDAGGNKHFKPECFLKDKAQR